MADVLKNKINPGKQYLLSILAVMLVAEIGYLVTDIIGYRSVALLLIVTVSILAAFFDIISVLVAAVLSALTWDFFFIPPHYTFSVGDMEDALLLLMYFVIALLNAVLTNRIRKIQKEAMQKREKEKIITLYNTLLNSLSHELKTPISTIIGSTNYLLTKRNNFSRENKTELLTTALCMKL